MKQTQLKFALIFFLAGFLLYVKTVNYEFTLDDKIYITHNSFVQQGWEGLPEVWKGDLMKGYTEQNFSNLLAGGRYRPLSLSLHILEQEVHGNDPAWSHFLNALLYGLLGTAVFYFLTALFPVEGSDRPLPWLALTATAIFITHPLHVEVVANVKSRDELLSNLLGFVALLALARFLSRGRFFYFLSGLLLFLLALLAKESAINLWIVFVGFLLLKNFRERLLKTRLITAISGLATTTLAFILLRSLATAPSLPEVPAELLNQVYLYASPAGKWAGILFVYGLSLKLLWWPWPLTHDYYPYHPFRTFEELSAGLSPYPRFSEPELILALVVLAALLGLWGWSTWRFSRSAFARLAFFCLLTFFGSTFLYSNIPFQIGSFFNERFLFLPSLAMALMAGYLLSSLVQRSRAGGLSVFALILLIYTGLSWNRTSRWKDDNTLVLTDVKTSTGSARANLLAAEASLNLHRSHSSNLELLDSRFVTFADQGVFYAQRALIIYPEYRAPLDILGNLYFEQGKVEESFGLFLKHYRLKGEKRVWQNLVYIAEQELKQEDYRQALRFFKQIAQVSPGPDGAAEMYHKQALIYGTALNRPDSSIFYLQKAIELAPERADFYANLGTALAYSRNLQGAKKALRRAIDLGTQDPAVFRNLGYIYSELGRPDSAHYYLEKVGE